jgi:tetratricopeptide (TPR) repeat protein
MSENVNASEAMLAGAIALINKFKFKSDVASAQERIIDSMLKMNKIQEAEHFLSKVKSKGIRSTVAKKIFRIYFESGDLQRANQFITPYLEETPEISDEVNAAHIDAAIERGDYASAFRLIELIGKPWIQKSIYVDISNKLVENYSVEEIFDFLNRFSLNEDVSDFIKVSISYSLLNQDKVDQALRFYETTRLGLNDVNFRLAWLRKLPIEDNLDFIRSEMEGMDNETREEFIHKILHYFQSVGDFEGMLNEIVSIRDTILKKRLFYNFDFKYKVGDFSILTRLKEEMIRVGAFREAEYFVEKQKVDYYIREGKFELAEQVIPEIRCDHILYYTCREVMFHYAKAGRFTRVLELLNLIDDEDTKKEVAEDLVEILLHYDLYNEALQVGSQLSWVDVGFINWMLAIYETEQGMYTKVLERLSPNSVTDMKTEITVGLVEKLITCAQNSSSESDLNVYFSALADGELKSEAMKCAVRLYLSFDQTALALHLLEEVKDMHLKSELLGLFSIHLFEKGKEAAAWNIYAGIQDEALKQICLLGFVRCATISQLEDILDSALMLSDIKCKVKVMIAIAEEYSERGCFEKAWLLFCSIYTMSYKEHEINALALDVFRGAMDFSGLDDFKPVQPDDNGVNILRFVFHQLSGLKLRNPIEQHINSIPVLSMRLEVFLYLAELFHLQQDIANAPAT